MDIKSIEGAMDGYIFSFVGESITCTINFENYRNKKVHLEWSVAYLENNGKDISVKIFNGLGGCGRVHTIINSENKEM